MTHIDTSHQVKHVIIEGIMLAVGVLGAFCGWLSF